MGGAWCEKKLETRERDRERDRALSSLFDPRFFVMKVKIKKKKPTQLSTTLTVAVAVRAVVAPHRVSSTYHTPHPSHSITPKSTHHPRKRSEMRGHKY